jgi:hypothetical protein
MNWIHYLNPVTLIWLYFMKRFKKIPPEYQDKVLQEYERAADSDGIMNTKLMWALLREGEREVKEKKSLSKY